MKPLIKIAIIVVVALALIMLADSFVVRSIKDRAIILGLGIDYHDGEYEIVCEVIGKSQTTPDSTGDSSFSQYVTGKGKTISLAVYDVYSKTGKLPSLGQCGILVLGESLYKEISLEQCLAYFSFSDAFSDGALIVCCEGEAKELFSRVTPLDSSISFAIAAIVSGSEHNSGIPYSYLSKFVSLQLTSSSSDILTVVSFTPDKETSTEQSDKQSGFFNANKVAIFRNFDYVDDLTEQEIEGLTLLVEPQSFDTFVVQSDDDSQALPKIVGVGIKSKKVDKKPEYKEGEAPSYSIKIDIEASRMRTDTTGDVMKYLAKEQSELSEYMQKQVEEQTIDCVRAVIKKAVDTNCDFLGISNEYYRNFGTEWIKHKENVENILSEINFSVKVTVDK